MSVIMKYLSRGQCDLGGLCWNHALLSQLCPSLVLWWLTLLLSGYSSRRVGSTHQGELTSVLEKNGPHDRHAPHLESTGELTLWLGVQVIWLWEHESRRADTSHLPCDGMGEEKMPLPFSPFYPWQLRELDPVYESETLSHVPHQLQHTEEWVLHSTWAVH